MTIILPENFLKSCAWRQGEKAMRERIAAFVLTVAYEDGQIDMQAEDLARMIRRRGLTPILKPKKRK